MSESTGRNAAEWATLAVSCLILMMVTLMIVIQALESQTPPAPVAKVMGPIREVGGDHHVSVIVTNAGRRTAANVQVSAELKIDDETSTADQTIDFLAGDEDEDLVFVFADDPADGELTVSVTGFSLP